MYELPRRRSKTVKAATPEGSDDEGEHESEDENVDSEEEGEVKTVAP